MANIKRLLEIMAALRNPVSGCPWDIKQSFESIAPYTIEEAYEVADAIAGKDYEALKDELGDLLLQVVYHSRMAEEQGLFGFEDVLEAICEKMVRRHPHVFVQDPQASVEEPAEGQIKKFWEDEKARERSGKGDQNVLDGIALALPALKRAQKMQKRAARVGFDWNDVKGVMAKIAEEFKELQSAMQANDTAAITDELGDCLFSYVNLARHMGLDAEDSLRLSNRKFEDRFRAMENCLKKQSKRIEDCDAGELEQLWQQVKQDLNC